MSRLVDRLARANIHAEECSLRPALPGYERTDHRWPTGPGRAAPRLVGGALDAVVLPVRGDLSAALRVVGGAAAAGVSRSAPAVFLDIETTGLGVGSGTLAFVVGLGWYEGDDLVTRQWTLRSPAGEIQMLEDVAATVQRARAFESVLVTFNGASFDLPVLRARLCLGRQDQATLGPPHLDLLHPTRRLWRHALPDCTLATVERELLGVRRKDDVRGCEIPAVFEDAVRNPEDPETLRSLGRVREHNLADLVVLPALAARAAQALEHPDSVATALGAARHLVATGDREGVLGKLEPWVDRGRSTGMEVDRCLREAALVVAAHHRRAGRHLRAAGIWDWLCRALPGDPDAHDALAKHLEHRARDPRYALRVALGSREPCPRRLARLRRKLLEAPFPRCKARCVTPF
jgi:uncharacterized protein YprB with RNaseH-like and TPR domain